MGNWEQIINESEEREAQRREPLEKPFGIRVKSISKESELAKVTYYSNRDRLINVTHPYVGPAAWIRAMPEDGTLFTGIFRSDEAPPQTITTYQRAVQERVKAYYNGRNIYRPLYPGELDLVSSGVGGIFMPRRPKADVRGGSITRQTDQDALSTMDKSPTHVRSTLQGTFDSLNDTERFGIVYRHENTWKQYYPKVAEDFAAEYYMQLLNPKQESPQPEVLFSIQKGHVIDQGGLQETQEITGLPLRVQERYYANDNSDTLYQTDENGNVFIRTAAAATDGYQLNIPTGFYKKNVAKNEVVSIQENREHNVGLSSTTLIGENSYTTVGQNIFITSEDGGSQMVFDANENAQKVYIRTNTHLFTLDDTTDKEAIYLMHSIGSQFNIDKEGSIKMVTAGGNLVFLDEPNGAVTVVSKNKATATFKNEITISDGSGKQVLAFDGSSKIQITASSDVVLSAGKVTVDAGSVNLGSNAVLSAVIGEQLSALFDAHTHATVVGASTPPVPPATAALFNANPATAFISQYVKIRSNIA